MPQSIPLHHHIEYSLKRERKEIYSSLAIKYFGLSMLSIFEVIYLLKFFNESVVATLFFIGILSIATGLLVPVGARLISVIGVKHAVLLANPFLFLYYLFLFFLPSFPFFIVFAAIASVVYKIIFFPAFHIDFARFTNPKHSGRQSSVIQIVVMASRVSGPFLGGLIIANMGFPPLFLAVLVLVLASALPLFFSREVHEVYSLTWFQAMRRVFQRKHMRTTIAFIAQTSENNIVIYVWPLFLFFIVGSYVTMGLITSAVFLLVVLVTLFLGRLADTIPRPKLLRIGVALNALGWLSRSIIQTDFHAFFSDTFARVTQRSAYVPFFTMFYDTAHSKGSEMDEYIVHREIVGNISGGITLLLIAGLYVVTGGFFAAFVLAALLSLVFTTLIAKNTVEQS